MSTTLTIDHADAQSENRAGLSAERTSSLTADELTTLYRCTLYLYGDSDVAAQSLADAALEVSRAERTEQKPLVHSLAAKVFERWRSIAPPNQPDANVFESLGLLDTPMSTQHADMMRWLADLAPDERFAISLWSVTDLSKTAIDEITGSESDRATGPLSRAIRSALDDASVFDRDRTPPDRS